MDPRSDPSSSEYTADLHERLAGIGSWRHDAGTGRLQLSGQAAAMLGAAQPIRTAPVLLDLAHPDDRATLAALLDPSHDLTEARCRFGQQDGARRLLLRGEPLVDGTGAAVASAGVVLDILADAAADREDEVQSRRRLDALLRSVIEATIDSPGPDELISGLTRLGVRDTTRWTYAASYVVETDLSLRLHTESGEGPLEGRTPCVATAADVAREGAAMWCCEDSRYAFPVHAEGEVALVFVLESSHGPVSRPQADLTAERVDDLCGWALERHRTQEALQAARRDAVRASAATSTFLAAVSHEVRTPLHTVLSLTDQALGTDLSPSQRELCQAAADSGEQLLSLLDDVLDLSAMEAGRLRLHSEDLDPRDVCDELAVHLAALAADRRDELLVIVDPAVPARLRGDAGRLSQVLTNLVARALHVTSQGTVVLTVSAQSAGRRTRLVAAVADGGPRLDEHELGQLFDPFPEADAGSVGGFAGGTGLGLAISRRLAHAMGGDITARAGADTGSVLTADLLLDPPRGPRTDAADDAARARVSDRRALVVCGDPLVAGAIGQMLGSWGARVETSDPIAAPGVMREAIDAENAFEVVVWDVDAGDQRDQGGQGGQGGQGSSGGFIAWCANEVSDPRHVPGAGEALMVERPLTRRALRAALLTSDGVVDPATGSTGPTAAQTAVIEAAREAAPGAASAAARDRVLLVADNPVNRLVARRMLEDLGCSVEAAEDEAEAVAVFDPSRHDLVMMDLRLPVMDGVRAAAGLREKSPSGVRTPIIAIVASQSDRRPALDAGLDDIVTKPFCADSLRPVVLRWAARARRDRADASASAPGVPRLLRMVDEPDRGPRKGEAAN